MSAPIQAQQADEARHRHAPADAETLAWNRAREAEWHAASAALAAMLREVASQVFNDNPPPLAIGVDVALTALLAGEFEASAIGHPTDAPAASAREFAAVLLSRRGGAP